MRAAGVPGVPRAAPSPERTWRSDESAASGAIRTFREISRVFRRRESRLWLDSFGPESLSLHSFPYLHFFLLICFSLDERREIRRIITIMLRIITRVREKQVRAVKRLSLGHGNPTFQQQTYGRRIKVIAGEGEEEIATEKIMRFWMKCAASERRVLVGHLDNS